MKNFLKTLLAGFLGTLIALFLCGFFLFALIGSIAALSEETTPIVPTNAILRINTSMSITEQSSNDPFAGLSSFNLEKAIRSTGILQVVNAIENAATDPSIKFIYLQAKGINMGMSHIEEVRNALIKFRASGKAVIAYGENFSQADYYLASVADKIYINSEATTLFTGVGMNMLFFKDILDKLGVQVQLIRHGKFKAAAEQFIAGNISPENREQNQQMLSSIWNTWVTGICETREITPEKFNSLIDNLQLGTASSMLENKLVDGVVSRAEMKEQLCTLLGITAEQSIKGISLQDYAQVTAKPNFKIKDRIAVVYANGEITMNGSKTLSAKEFYPFFNQFRYDKNIKAVVLRINSPGGDAQAAEILNNEIQLLRKEKPVIVSMGDYAASGGYWIAAQTDRIFTENTTLTGSIGVFSLYMNVGKGLQKHLSINNVSLGTNKHAGMLNGITSLDEAETKYMQGFVEKIYTQFTDLVASGRSLPVAYVDSVGQGRVWTGADAIALKLADERGGLSDAIQYAATLVGLDQYRLIEYPVVKSSFEKLMETVSSAESNAQILANPYALIEKVYAGLNDENGVKTYARAPYLYEFSY